jgi:hypothetical protein
MQLDVNYECAQAELKVRPGSVVWVEYLHLTVSLHSSTVYFSLTVSSVLRTEMVLETFDLLAIHTRDAVACLGILYCILNMF